MNIRKLSLISLAMAILAVVSACSDDGTPTNEITLYDIAKLESVNKTGSVFTLQKPEATEEVRLACHQLIPSEAVKVGDRVLIAYVPAGGKPYTSGNATLKGYRPITNAEMAESADVSIEEWDKTPVYLMSAWRSGAYLNLRTRLSYYEKPRRMALVRDAESLEPTRPELYLVHCIDEDLNTFDREYYISFDISALTSDTSIEGFTLHLNNSNLPVGDIPFEL